MRFYLFLQRLKMRFSNQCAHFDCFFPKFIFLLCFFPDCINVFLNTHNHRVKCTADISYFIMAGRIEHFNVEISVCNFQRNSRNFCKRKSNARNTEIDKQNRKNKKKKHHYYRNIQQYHRTFFVCLVSFCVRFKIKHIQRKNFIAQKRVALKCFGIIFFNVGCII